MASPQPAKTLLSQLYKWTKTQGDAVFMHQPFDGKWNTYTWNQFDDQVRRMASALHALNLPPKSKIGIISKNCAHWLMSDLAIMMSGHISVPLYPNINAETMNYVLTHSEAKALFVGKLDDWAGMKSGLPEDLYCISYPMYEEAGYNKWNDLISKHEPMQGEVDRDLSDTMTIIYTSGTTGKPKGVEHTFESIGFAIANALTVISVPPNSRFFSYLPLSHIAERMLVEMGSMFNGSQIYFAESLATFADNLRTASPTIFLGVPRIWTKFQMGILAKQPQEKLDKLIRIPLLGNFVKRKIRKALGLNDAVHCFTGAAPTPRSLMEWFKKLGITIQEVYGMTENSAYSHYTRKDNIKYGSTGQPMPQVDVKISDVGEILVKSKANMVGYYKQPELTESTFEDGYLKTGDKGKIDAQGFLSITGRVKDIFKTEKGKYVSPSPIELKLSKNSNIEQVCVVGTGLPQPIALVVLSEDAQKKGQKEIETSLANTLKEVNPVLEKHEKLKKMVVLKKMWSVENGCLTPTLKIKRGPIEDQFVHLYTTWYKEEPEVLWEN